MDELTTHEENAYNRVYKWATNHSKTFVNPDLSLIMLNSDNFELLKCTIIKIKERRPVLFAYVQDVLATTRAKVVEETFLSALTGIQQQSTITSSSSTSSKSWINWKPIEIFSHDPVRFIGDMCAWLHQQVASEAEFLKALFPSQKGQKPSQGSSMAMGLSVHASSQQLVGLDEERVLANVFGLNISKVFKVNTNEISLKIPLIGEIRRNDFTKTFRNSINPINEHSRILRSNFF
jgi:hypothetical protein